MTSCAKEEKEEEEEEEKEEKERGWKKRDLSFIW